MTAAIATYRSPGSEIPRLNTEVTHGWMNDAEIEKRVCMRVLKRIPVTIAGFNDALAALARHG